MQRALERFRELIICGEYYEAHEALEAIWYPRRREKALEVFALKGFINASVALELCKRGKKEGALRVWQTYAKYKPTTLGYDEELFLDLERFLDSYGRQLLS